MGAPSETSLSTTDTEAAKNLEEKNLEGNILRKYNHDLEGNMNKGDAPAPHSKEHKKDKPKPRSGCDFLSLLILITLIIGVAALLLEIVAFVPDVNWDLILTGEMDFPPLPYPEYFSGKIFNINQTEPALEKILEMFSRQDSKEPIAIAGMTIYLVVVIFPIVVYTQIKGSYTTQSVLHIMGGIVMGISAILILSSSAHFASNHKHGADALETYYKGLVSSPISSLTLENKEVFMEQVEILIQIEDMCAYSESHGAKVNGWGVDFIQIHKKSYDLADLQLLGFCAKQNFKFAAFVLCIIYTILSLGVPFCLCYQKRKVTKVHPAVGFEQSSSISPSLAAIGEGGIPPAFDYALPTAGKQPSSTLPSLAQGETIFDPRFAPLPPRPDLAIAFNLFDESKKRANVGEAFTDDESQFEPMEFQSLQNIPNTQNEDSSTGFAPQQRPVTAPPQKSKKKSKKNKKKKDGLGKTDENLDFTK